MLQQRARTELSRQMPYGAFSGYLDAVFSKFLFSWLDDVPVASEYRAGTTYRWQKCAPAHLHR